MTEQGYKAVQAVLADGRTVIEVASDWGVCRRTLHRWLARYEDRGMEALGDRSHRPVQCPHQMPTEIEVIVNGFGAFLLGFVPSLIWVLCISIAIWQLRQPSVAQVRAVT